MPARVVVVHDDPEFIKRTVTALLVAGHEVAAFSDTMAATAALPTSQRMDILITRMRFPQGQPHGVSLARMTRMKHPGVKVLFVAWPEFTAHAEGVGEFLPIWAGTADIIAAVERLLSEPT
jgi:DNA-binding NtrC family response regulator